MAVDRRTTIGKMIDNTKVVYKCMKCSRLQIGDINTDVSRCERCNHTDKDGNTLLVIEGNLVVRK